MGRRDPRRRGHRRRAGRSASAPTSAPGRTRSSARPQEYWKWFGAFKDMHDRLRELGKPTIARINGIAVGGGNELQMACDLAVMVDDAFIRHVGLEHGSVPAGGATQWLPADGRRPPRARDHPPLRRDPRGAGGRVGARQPRRARRGARRRRRRAGSRASRASCRRRRATRSSSSTSGATSRGTRRSATRATGWRSRCSATRRRARSRRSSSPGGRTRLADGRRGADEPRRRRAHDHAQPAGGLQRVQPRAARRPPRGARRRPQTRRPLRRRHRCRARVLRRPGSAGVQRRLPGRSRDALEATYHPEHPPRSARSRSR